MQDLLKGKRILVTGSSSGIGWETAKLLTQQGAEVLGVDINKNFDHVEEFYRVDLSDPRAIDALIDVLPDGIDGLVNNAGLPPTRPAEQLLAINLLTIKHLTNGIAKRLNDNASIVNVASLAGFGWPQAIPAIKASEQLTFDAIPAFMAEHNIRIGVRNHASPRAARRLRNSSAWAPAINPAMAAMIRPSDHGTQPKRIEVMDETSAAKIWARDRNNGAVSAMKHTGTAKSSE